MNDIEKMSYALGMNVAGNICELPLEIDNAAFVKALETVLILNTVLCLWLTFYCILDNLLEMCKEKRETGKGEKKESERTSNQAVLPDKRQIHF